jgi:release factor glutamine methyltransferase
LRLMQERRRQGEPLQYILGEWDFMGFVLKCDRRALIPRPETEILVDALVRHIRSDHRFDGRTLRALDMGTGSGNIAISLAKLLPSCMVTAVDISGDALSLARENAVYHGVDGRIRFVPACLIDFLETSFRCDSSFDMIVSNPPYIATSLINRLSREVRQEPLIALDGGKDGLHYLGQIVSHAGSVLRRPGILCLEIGDGQGVDVERLILQHLSHGELRFIRDDRGIDRVVLVSLG